MTRLKSERGSSSVLVALALIILVVFSVLAVTTSAANLRLARKNAETTRAFYSLDSEGERFVNTVYNSVISGRKKAAEAIRMISGGNIGKAGLPDQIAGIIAATLDGISGSATRSRYLDSLYRKLVSYYAISAMEEAYPGCVYSKDADFQQNHHVYSNVPVGLGFSVKKTFILEYENSLRYLSVDMVIPNPADGDDIKEICDIREWRMWQEAFEYSNEIDLWEGVP